MTNKRGSNNDWKKIDIVCMKRKQIIESLFQQYGIKKKSK